VVLGCQEGRQQANRGEVDRAVDKPLQNHWKPACGPRRLDAVIGCVLRQMEHLPAVAEERRAAFGEIQAPRIELHQRSDQRSRRAPFDCGEALDLGEQLSVRKIRGRNVGCVHASFVAWRFSTSLDARRRAANPAEATHAGLDRKHRAERVVVRCRASVVSGSGATRRRSKKLSRDFCTVLRIELVLERVGERAHDRRTHAGTSRSGDPACSERLSATRTAPPQSSRFRAGRRSGASA
jgi:hypothetical protein